MRKDLRKLSMEQIEDVVDKLEERIENLQVETFNKGNYINICEKRLIEANKTNEKLQNKNSDLEKTIEEYKEVIQFLEEKIAKYEEAEKEPVEFSSQSECDCCGCCDDPDDDFDIEALVIEQQIEIEKLNATIDVLLGRIV